MRSAQPTLLFDVMDTLVVDPFRDAIPEFFGLGLRELIEQAHPTAWVEFERGELSPEQYATRMFSDARHVDWPAFEAHVRGAYRWIEGMPELLAELCRAEIDMHALSNYPVLYRVVEQELAISRYVKWSFVSCDTGHRKPSPEAFLGAARALGRSPAECLLIDDRAVNCDAAEAVGMPAVRFESTSSLRLALARRGLLRAIGPAGERHQ